MGIFSSIGKLFKKVWSGITKVFKAIAKPITKFLDSKLGRSLMLAVSVFTMGSALIAGGKGFLAGEGFIGKFVNGGKEFLNTLIGTNMETVQPGGATDMAGNVAAGEGGFLGQASEGALNPGDVLTEGTTGALGEAAAVGDPNALAQMTAPGGTGIPTGGNLAPPAAPAAAVAEESGGWLSKAANTALEFAKSDSGATIIGNMIAGAGAGARQKEQNEFDSRVERMFANPNDPGMLALAEHDYSVDTPRGLAGASSEYARRLNRDTGRYTPNIPFRHPVTAPGG